MLKVVYQMSMVMCASSALLIRLHDTLLVAVQRGHTITQGLVSFFSFFTVLTTMAIITSLLSVCCFPATCMGRFFSRASVKASFVVYIVVVAGIYHVLLAHLWCPEGFNLYADLVLHYGLPAAYTAYWLLYTPKGLLHWYHAIKWICFPAVYSMYVLVRGHFTNSYPYHFGNVTQLGYVRALVNTAGVLCGFIGIGLVVTMIDSWLAKRDSRIA